MKELVLYMYVFLLIALSAFGAHRYYMIYLYRKHKNNPRVPLKYFDELPAVTIQLPLFNEKYVVDRLLEAVAAIRYPRDRFEIQVLDDSTDDTSCIAERKCDEIRKRGLDIKYLHRAERAGFKAGALEHGLQTARGELVAIFDADFLPDADFLEKSIHHFTDPGVGMVQARWDHINRDWSVLTESQGILLDGHFIIEHTARNRSGRFFNFNGTAGIWRKRTIEDAGGWQHDTLTEDLDLSYRAQLKGWRFVYLPELTVPAELPIEISSFKSQQFRWAKGSIQVFLKLFPTIVRSRIPWRVKVESFFHLGANLAYVLLTLFCVLLPFTIILQSRRGMEEVFFDMPVFVLATVSVMIFYFYSEVIVINETRSMACRSRWSPLLYLPITMSIGIGLAVNNTWAVLEALFKKKSPFVRTPKYDVKKKNPEHPHDYNVLCNVYRSKALNGIAVAELLFAIYFTCTIFFALHSLRWFSVPFLMLFQFGFLYISFTTLLGGSLPMLRRRFRNASCEAGVAPATIEAQLKHSASRGS